MNTRAAELESKIRDIINLATKTVVDKESQVLLLLNLTDEQKQVLVPE